MTVLWFERREGVRAERERREERARSEGRGVRRRAAVSQSSLYPRRRCAGLFRLLQGSFYRSLSTVQISFIGLFVMFQGLCRTLSTVARLFCRALSAVSGRLFRALLIFSRLFWNKRPA